MVERIEIMHNQKILFILPFLPYPMSSGGHQALYNSVASVCRDYDVYLTYETRDSDAYQKNVVEFQRKLPEVTILPLVHARLSNNNSVRNRLKRMYNYMFKKTYNVSSWNDDLKNKWLYSINPSTLLWQNHIDSIFDKYSFDIIQVEMPWLLPCVLSLPENTKKVFVHHELGFVRRELELKSNNYGNYGEMLKKYVDIFEIGLLNKYDDIISLSPIDSEKLKLAGVTKPVYTSFAIIESFNEMSPVLGEGKRLVFVGPDNHSPNFIGISWFLENCWHRLKKIDKDYQLYIIGRWSQDNIDAFTAKYNGVNFLGFVNDLREELRDSIMIVPITIGSGIRMKILEAASNGVPFVSTTVGAEGIPVKNGKDCFLADSPDEFVDSIVKLKDRSLQERFVCSANKMLKENYSLEALRRNRIQIYNTILSYNR